MLKQTSIKHRKIYVKKASGEDELFELDKLERSLLNAGASHFYIQKILADIDNWAEQGVTTKKIYSRAFSILQKEKTNVALRYKLKQAIMELGPTGYPFEQYIGKLFNAQGYITQVGIVIEGQCVTHEMDVIATKDGIQHLMECKYHKDQGKRVGVQVPLYVRSRVNDIIEKRKNMPDYQGLSFSAWVVTNTRLSEDSIQYGNCAGLHLLAWDYPRGKGLKNMIESLKVYPITILTQLLKKEKQVLLDQGIISCSELFQDTEALKKLSLSHQKYQAVLKELQDICN